jgi:hypothetical protein
VHPKQPRQATQRLHNAQATHPILPATASDMAVAILPATAALPAVAIEPATAVLATVAADPATPALATVATDPATPALATVAAEPATAELSTVVFDPATDGETGCTMAAIMPDSVRGSPVVDQTHPTLHVSRTNSGTPAQR